MKNDIHFLAKEIMTDLQNLGYIEESKKIEESILYNSTGSEILMSLLFNLSNIITAHNKKNPLLKSKINHLITEINNAL